MPTDATFESFEKELNRLVESFGKRLAELKQPGYAEAQLRDDFLNPFFRALGWDMENRSGLIQKEREVENRADKSRHDKMVVLVDKLLGLMPKLRAAMADSEKATLQNAVTATDQQIDALVYELYGLTEAEKNLVEGGQ